MTSAAEPAAHDAAVDRERTWALARCACGWSGPRRRAVASAQRDAERHAAGQGG